MLEFTHLTKPEVLPESPIELVEPKGKGLDEAFEEFLGFEVADGAASINTIDNYKSQTKMFLQWCIDAEVNPLLAEKRHIQLYRKHLIEKYQPATIQFKLQVVRRFYDALIEGQLIEYNPAINVKAPINKRSNVKIQYLDLLQLQQLLKLVEGNSPKQKRDRVIVGLMALQGLRTIEVQRLSFGDFSRQGKKNFITVSAKRSQRRIQLREDLYSWVLDHLAGKKLTKNLPIICSESGNNYGERISLDGIRRTVNGYLQQMGLRKGEIRLSNHALRHTFGTQVYAKSKDLRLVQDAMGHSDPRTTAKYAHVINETAAADFIEL